MADADGFEVHIGAMRDHAARLDDIQAQVGAARNAAGEASLNGTAAYGVLCGPILLPLMGSIELLGIGAVVAIEEAVGATAMGVRAMADEYEEFQQEIVDLFRSISEELPR